MTERTESIYFNGNRGARLFGGVDGGIGELEGGELLAFKKEASIGAKVTMRFQVSSLRFSRRAIKETLTLNLHHAAEQTF